MILNLTKAEFATLKAVIGEIDGYTYERLIASTNKSYKKHYNPDIELANFNFLHSVWRKMDSKRVKL